ncbi:MAG: hypothetical protein HYR67_05500 [Bacteroidetes bacterium]|nr:hypothetical protein [Bacteroidota bacterium]
MKKLLTILFAFVSIIIFAQKKQAPDNRLAGIDEKLQALLTEWKVADFAVAVIEKNKVMDFRQTLVSFPPTVLA